MTRRELIEFVQRSDNNTELTAAQIGHVLDAAFAGIASALQQEGRFSHPGFGTFTRVEQPARPGIHPRTGERIMVEATTTIRFKPSREFKSTLGE